MTTVDSPQGAREEVERPGWWNQETPAQWGEGGGLLWVFRVLGVGVFIARDLDAAVERLAEHCEEQTGLLEQTLLDRCPRTAGEVAHLPLSRPVTVEAHVIAPYLRSQVTRLDAMKAEVLAWEKAINGTLATVGQAAVLAGCGDQLFVKTEPPTTQTPFGTNPPPSRWELGMDPDRLRRVAAEAQSYELAEFCGEYSSARRKERNQEEAEREVARGNTQRQLALTKERDSGIRNWLGYLNASDADQLVADHPEEEEALRLHRLWKAEADGAAKEEALRVLEDWLISRVLKLDAPSEAVQVDDGDEIVFGSHAPPALSAENREFATRVADAVLALDPDASGYLVIRKNEGEVSATGQLTSRLPDLSTSLGDVLATFVPADDRPFVSNETVRGLHVVVDEEVGREVASRSLESRQLDEVSVIYQGSLATSLIRPSGIYKQLNWQTREKIADCARVLGFLTPLVLDRTLTVVDGDLRLSVALELAAGGYERMNRVPVVVLDDAGVRAHFLRLALNRSSEFQRWDHATVNAYVDEHPQVQPLLEPLGFFGERLLPETFFGNSIQDYAIDPYNEAQAQYKQELGLAEWARIRRREVAQGRAKPKRWVTPPTTSLFDLRPDPDDFLPTYEARAEMDAFVQVQEEMGARVTETYDAATEAGKEGWQWQSTRRTTREATQARREAAEGGT